MFINKKVGGIEIQTLFYIIMGLFMIGIIIFGINKIFFVKNILSEQDRVLIINQIQKGFEYCEDPLNKGNFERIKLKGKEFNSICFLANDSNKIYSIYPDLRKIKNSGNNVVILKTITIGGNNISNLDIIYSFNIGPIVDETFCKFDYNNSGTLDFNLVCN